MPEILTEKLVPGLEVVADVTNSNGQLILREGVLITERHIQILKTWGIRSVRVAGEGEENLIQSLRIEEVPQEVYQKHEKVMAHRFQHSDITFPPIRVVREYCIIRSIQQKREVP